jgi:hypothetical protein
MQKMPGTYIRIYSNRYMYLMWIKDTKFNNKNIWTIGKFIWWLKETFKWIFLKY